MATAPDLDFATAFRGSGVPLAVTGAMLIALGAMSAFGIPRRADGIAAALQWSGLVFGIEGLILSVAAYRAHQNARRRSELAERYPASPWLWRDDWANRRISSGRPAALFAEGALHSVLAVMFGPALYFGIPWKNPDGGESTAPIWLMGGIAVTVVIAAAAVGTRILHAWRFRFATLEIPDGPGRIGGDFRAFAVLPFRPKSATPHRLSLSCYAFAGNQGGPIWHSEQEIAAAAAEARQDGFALPVRFTIPAQCEPCRDEPGKVFWRLRIASGSTWFGYYDFFDVPVFHVEGSTAPVPRRDAPDAPISADKLSIGRTAAGALEMTIRSARNDVSWLHGGKARSAVAAAAAASAIEFAGRLFLHGSDSWWRIAALAILATFVVLAAIAIERRPYVTTVTADRQVLRIRQRRILLARRREYPREAIYGISIRPAGLDEGEQLHAIVLDGDDAPAGDLGVAVERARAEKIAHELRHELGLVV